MQAEKQKLKQAAGMKMADRTGLEPATSGVTGRHSNQLNYRSAIFIPAACFSFCFSSCILPTPFNRFAF